MASIFISSRRIVPVLLLWVAPLGSFAANSASSRPNIVLILADDMGIGDAGCFNPESKIPTPHIDRLAAEGMRFIDAHAPGATCVPSRYGLLTGRYPFRPKPRGKGPLIEAGRETIGTLLKSRGYVTAMVGKWHLGFEGGMDFKYDQPLRGGPTDHGFDSFFGMHASLDIPPYFYIDNDRVVAAATNTIEASHSKDWEPNQGAFWRAGHIAPGFEHEQVLPTFTRKAVEWLDSRRDVNSAPFFLYLALTAPHTPWLPAERFRGTSGAGLYGDFTAQVDDTVGQVLAALDRNGKRDNTLVIFTSDNGPVWFPADVERFHHAAVGNYRGLKGDPWEGGHRMPFVARWPGIVAAGSTSKDPICFTDVLATFAGILGVPMPDDAGEDSVSFLSSLRGEPGGWAERPMIVQSSQGTLTIRVGDWKLITRPGGGFLQPTTVHPQPGGPPGQLYNLSRDPSEQRNVWNENPRIIERLTALLERMSSEGRTAIPGRFVK